MTTETPLRKPSSSATKVKQDPTMPMPIASPNSRRHKALTGLIDYLSIPLLGKAALEQSKLDEGQISAFALDLETVSLNKDNLAAGIVEVAEEYPVIGVLIDKLGVAGPIAGLVTTVITMGLQIAENHSKLPEQIRSAAPVIPAQDLARSILDQAAKRQSNGND